MELRCSNCREVLVFVKTSFQDVYSVKSCISCNPKLLGFIQNFAVVMDAQLRDGPIQSTWMKAPNLECITAVHSLVQSLSDDCVNQKPPIEVRREAADAALFLCFLAENYARKGK